MTSEEIRSMTPGPEMDAAVHKLLGLEPERVAIATSDGGKSACASVSQIGPWHSKEELVAWLAEGQDRGLYTEYMIGEWLRYPHYSADIDAAWEMETEIERRGHGMPVTYVVCLKKVLGRNFGVRDWRDDWALIRATPEQRCRAALLALAAAGK